MTSTAALALGLLVPAALLLLLRAPLLAILLVATASVHLAWGPGRLDYIADDLWLALDKELIVAIPLYLLCGQVIARGSSARRLVAIAVALTPRLPGGLAVAGTLAFAVDASISGSSVATMLTVGSVLVPALVKAGYDERYALGAAMAGGSLGVIIPPSIPLLVYAIVTETSVIDLYRAAIGPGLLLATTFAGYAVWRHRDRPTRAFDAAELARALREGRWALLLPLVLLGGVYGGVLGSVDSAACLLLAAVGVECFAHRALGLRDLHAAVLAVARMAGALLPIVALALSLSLVLTEQGVFAALVQAVRSVVDSPLAFMLAANVLLLAAGCVMTIDAAIVVFAPLLVPLAVAYGYDKVLFGVIMILNLEVGFITPPVGMNLLVAASAFERPFGMLCRAALPFIGLMLACLALVIWQPWLAAG